MMYPFSFSCLSMDAVKTGTSGNAFWKVAMPSGAASRQTNLMLVAPAALSRLIAATAELPVASIGSTTMNSRSSRCSGSFM